MQCYEHKAMRLYFYKTLSARYPQLSYDDWVLSDLLCERGIASFEDLLKLDLEELEDLAQQFRTELMSLVSLALAA